jgi:hypothetical protein
MMVCRGTGNASHELRLLAADSRDCTQLDSVGIVHRKDANGGASGRCEAHEAILLQCEMIVPRISPGVKKRDHLTGMRIDAREIGTLV